MRRLLQRALAAISEATETAVAKQPEARLLSIHTEDPRKSPREQALEWLGQRQSYLDDHYNGPPQTLADVRAQYVAELKAHDPSVYQGPAKLRWDDALKDFVEDKT